VAAVRWSLAAESDLRSIVQFITRRSPAYAAATAERILAAAGTLAELPRMGRIVPEYGIETVREVILPPYRLVYRIEANGIGVIGVIHAHRDIMRKLGSEPS
jgi:plasmid stabilization system protein ParE